MGFSVASEADSAELLRLGFSAGADAAEIVRGVLSELVPSGWSEVKGDDELVRFDLWVPRREPDPGARLERALAAAGLTLQVSGTPEDDRWRDGLRRHHHPIDVGARLRVRPPWEVAVPDRIDVVIDPGMAFGTGQHATTRGCLELLLAVPAGRFLDVGCGSGVLAIAAALLGHAPVTGLDHDPLAVEAAVRNAGANGVVAEFSLADASAGVVPACEALAANLTRRDVIALAGVVGTRPPRHAILSGFLEADVPAVVEHWSPLGFVEVARRVEDGWAAVLLGRPR